MTLRISPARLGLQGGLHPIGYGAFLLFAATAFWGPAGPYLALLILIPWMMYRCRSGDNALRTSPLVWLAWLLTAYIALRVLTGYLADPSTLEWQEKTFSEYLRISGLWAVVLAPWLAERERGVRNLHLLFGLALFGFLGESLLTVLSGDLGQFWGGQDQPWAGLLDPAPTWRLSLTSGPNGSAVILGFFLLFVTIVGGSKLGRLAYRGRRPLALAVLPLWVVLVSVLGWFLILTGSRSAWSALAVVLGLALVGVTWTAVRFRFLPKGRLLMVGAGLVVLIAAGLIVSQYSLIEVRYLKGEDSLSKIVTLRFAELEPDPVSFRVWLYELGVRMVPEKPIFGWSPGGVEAVIERNGNPHIAGFSHIHNTHLEILLALGAVGFALFYAMVVLSAVEIWKALRHGRLAPEWGVFWFIATAFVGLEEFFDTRFFIYECGLLMALLGALGIGCQISRLQAMEEIEERSSNLSGEDTAVLK